MSELLWTQTGWQAQAQDWIRQELAQRGIEISEAIEQPHIRPWSTVMRIPSSAGLLFFKATLPVLAHEPALTERLSAWEPDRMPVVVVSDPSRGWMILEDMRATLRTIVKSPADLFHWETILDELARLQQKLIPHQDEILGLGALDRRLAILPERYAALLEDRQALLIGQERGLTEEQYLALRAYTLRFRELCERLAGFGIPESLHHEDFHDANVFVKDGRYIFSDWGEAGVAHPFSTLLVCLRSTSWRLEFPQEDQAPQMQALRDHYLRRWGAYGELADLQEAYRLAYATGMIIRALTWYAVVNPLDEPQRSEYLYTVPAWLDEFYVACLGN